MKFDINKIKAAHKVAPGMVYQGSLVKYRGMAVIGMKGAENSATHYNPFTAHHAIEVRYDILVMTDPEHIYELKCVSGGSVVDKYDVEGGYIAKQERKEAAARFKQIEHDVRTEIHYGKEYEDV